MEKYVKNSKIKDVSLRSLPNTLGFWKKRTEVMIYKRAFLRLYTSWKKEELETKSKAKPFQLCCFICLTEIQKKSDLNFENKCEGNWPSNWYTTALKFL